MYLSFFSMDFGYYIIFKVFPLTKLYSLLFSFNTFVVFSVQLMLKLFLWMMWIRDLTMFLPNKLVNIILNNLISFCFIFLRRRNGFSLSPWIDKPQGSAEPVLAGIHAHMSGLENRVPWLTAALNHTEWEFGESLQKKGRCCSQCRRGQKNLDR